MNLTRCNLAHHHIKLFLDKIIKKTNIEELQLAENDLSAVPIKLLSECVRCLKIVNFSQAGLSKTQIIKILRDIRNSKETKIESLDLRNRYESLLEELINNVKEKIKILKI